MNVGQILRSMLNDTQPGEPKTLELKVGQVVKGLVLQLLTEQDALVNIGGVQLKAHMETPLKQGEVTLLQVQPESPNGQIVLKPITNSTILITEDSLADVLQTMGLKDTPVNRQVIQMLHQENLPVTPENTQAFAKVMAQLPPQTRMDAWQQAGILALKNNLPVTIESISALHQVIFGPPIKEQLNQLAQQIDRTNLQALPQRVSESMSQVKQLLTELLTVSENALNETVVSGEDGPKEAPTLQTPGAPADGSESKSTIRREINVSIPQHHSELLPLKNDISNSNLTNKSLSATGEKEKHSIAAFTETAKAEASAAGNKAAKLPEVEVKASTTPVTESNAGVSKPINDENTQWISKWLKSLGVEHEQQLFKALDKWTGQEKLANKLGQDLDLQAFTAAATDGSDPAAETAKQTVTDSLKSALLQLHALADTPPAVKDGAQQLLQQITGQQLLLSPDRTSMFSHITMMIPMRNDSGQQTAAVHIQSRKGSRGEIDATNCRLVFDLQMKSIGNTLVDVQVYNKIVSLHVHNDHDVVAQLLDGSRDEIAASLQNAGYQFLSLKCTPFPEQAGEQTEAMPGDVGRNTGTTRYSSKPYKGVDVRV